MITEAYNKDCKINQHSINLEESGNDYRCKDDAIEYTDLTSGYQGK